MSGHANGGAVAARLQAIESQQRDNMARMDNLGNDIYRRLDAVNTAIVALHRPNIAIWLSAAGIALGLTLAVLQSQSNTMETRIKPMEEDIKRVERAYMGMDKSMLDQFERHRSEDRTERLLLAEEQRRIRGELVADVKEVRLAQVGRSEHDQRYRAINDQILNLTHRLDETRKTLADIYGPVDAFKDIQKQVDDLRALVIQNARGFSDVVRTPVPQLPPVRQ